MTPGIVVRQPTTSITEDGHSTCAKSVLPIHKTPATPNQSRLRMIPDVMSPMMQPRTTAFRVVKSGSFIPDDAHPL